MTGGQIGNVDLVKQLNSAAVYRLIDLQGPISRIQVADISHLAPASVTKITRQLLERGLIKEVAQQASTGGRRAISLTTESVDFHSIAVRIGRNYIEITLYDLSGKHITGAAYPFLYSDQYVLAEGLIKYIQEFIDNNQNVMKELVALGIILPGLVNPENGTVTYMPNIKVHDFELAHIIQDTFGIITFVGNDIRGLALAEHFFGASRDCKDSILVSMHNGTGAGIIVNGQVFLGQNRNVGEIGHIQIDPLGDKCQCGNFGCLETVASDPAVIEHVQQLLNQGYPSSLQALEELTMLAICDAANEGDELATQVLLKVGHHLGKALAMTINLFNPQKIILAGNITQAQAIVLPAIRRCVENQSLAAFNNGLPIVASELYNQPTIGAFSMIKRAMLNGVLLQRLLED
ncbi:DNA-binding transcriptional regulator NagC [Photobacterium kishitanii]|uniref:DNA-binding transcriptional regulator NagC n=1 Tax=Photobacterium kishitanii TaxID=318456 RepID=UPI0007F8887D|nr:ROK family protein [Photobacterium kishitanii]OBU34716.1 transcriptional regulator [Photobacterium kishitanii]PSW50977.1 transcriptional regulator [Photobacterium kishitanii]